VHGAARSMSHRTAILAALKKSGALCDDCLSEVTEITPRQTINMTCRSLHSSKTLSRPRETCLRCKRVKIVNRLLSDAPIERRAPVTQTTGVISAKNDRPWYWEGNVQTKIVKFLSSQGCTVHSESDTATRQQGKDIIAADCDGRTIWVTVKGFPDKSKNIQARHWFAGALLDLARYRDENADAFLAMGLPSGFTTYESLIRRTEQTRKFLGYSVYWVQPDGTVTRDDPPGKAEQSVK
jgi:hypothetical protein